MAGFPLHPLLFAVWPILQLFTVAMNEADPWSAARSLCVALAVTAAIWAAATWTTGDAKKGAIVTTLLIVLNLAFTGSAAAVVGAFLLWVGAAAMVARTRRSLDAVTTGLDVLGALVVVMSLVTIAGRWPKNPVPALPPIAVPEAAEMGAPRPHVFYIVVDGFGREDVLRARYGVDLEPLRAQLVARGFYVAERSRSNYAQTALSLASSLNATYLDSRCPDRDRRWLTHMIDRSRVVEALRARGWGFATLGSGMAITYLHSPDVVLSSPLFLDEFEHALLSMTSLPRWLEIARALPGGAVVPDQYDAHRARVRYFFAHLADPAASERPLFVLAHVVSPHPPFVFRADGTRPALSVPPPVFFLDGEHSMPHERYVPGYREQATFVAGEVGRAVDRILATAKVPPVIVIQGDHGPGGLWHTEDTAKTSVLERFPIFNAYYFPDRDYRDLRPDITPVNTFRVVLNHVLGTELPEVEDKSYFSTWAELCRFVDVGARIDADERGLPGRR